ncbi:MAG: hypothetical protein B7X10_02125 [Burkholderiales bacterium 21-58-4]|nr:MAG: hypothetical protein B7X10_02125 [Burkholderiales bacterium 21-58-4]
MSGNITFNPMLTTVAASSFTVSTDGYVQGTVFDDPGLRYQIRGGFVANTVTQPVWGGLPLSVAIPANSSGIGPSLTLATTIANITGWSVFNQANNMILTPGPNVPVSTIGMGVNFIEPGCGLRLAVKCSTSLLSALPGEAQNTQVQWDFTNNQLEAYVSGTALPVVVEFVSSTSKVVVYNSGTGAVTWDDAGPCAVIRV